MNTYDRGGPGISGNSFDRWVQRSDISDDSAMIKMQHQFWVTKQALSRKLGKKEDECIVSSDAELDAKLELFRSIQESCLYLQRVIDKYQERLCNLAEEENAMGRFLKEAGKQDKTRAGKMMIAVGKSLSFSSQQRLTLRAPLVRLYQEVETFRQRAIEDTLQNVQAMEKARIEYRAALSWMKNVSQELDPDTSKQLERFRKVQTRVRRGKAAFDTLALDCLQKVDLLAAARCNMFSHALVMYQSTLLTFTKKSAYAYGTIANSFKGHQPYDFTVVRELAETSSKLAKETGGDDIDDKDKLLFFESDYHDEVEEAQEAQATAEAPVAESGKQDEKLLDIESDADDILDLENLELSSSILKMDNPKSSPSKNYDTGLDEFFSGLMAEGNASREDDPTKNKMNKTQTNCDLDVQASLAGLNLTMGSFIGESGNKDSLDFTSPSLDLLTSQNQTQQSFHHLTSESVALLDDILNGGLNTDAELDTISSDTFLPPGILKQSLGAATLGTGQKLYPTNSNDKKKNKSGKQGGSSWLDLFAELDPLANNPMENLSNDGNAPA